MLLSILILWSFITPYLSQTTGPGVTFVASPANFTALNGTSVTVQCAIISDTDIKTIMWYQGIVLLSLDSDVLNPNQERIQLKVMSDDEILKLLPEGSPTPKFMRGYNLTFSPLLPQDDNEISCRTVQTVSKSAFITVLVPPTPPVLTSSVAISDWTENQPITFTCTSGEGNPFSAISIDWLYSGQVLFPPDGLPLLPNVKSTTTPPLKKFGEFKTELTLNLTLPIFNEIISCRVSHNSPPKGETWTYETPGLTLKFKYGPYMRVMVASGSKSDDLIKLPSNVIKIIESSNLTLNCSLDSYPLPNTTERVSWTYGNTTLPGSTLELKFILREVIGVMYVCHTNEGVPYTETNLTLDVLYPPKLKFPPNITDSTSRIVEGSNLNFSFVIIANPFPYQDDFHWLDGSIEISKGQYLIMKQAERHMSKYYTCKVTNAMLPFYLDSAVIGTDELSVRVVVNFIPGRAVLTSNKVSAYAGSSVNFTCTVFGSDAKSDMEIIWKKGDILMDINSTSQSWSFLDSSSLSPPDSTYFVASLIINEVTTEDIGEYRCMGTNSAGGGTWSDAIAFDVFDVPTLVSYSPTKNLLEPSEGDILEPLVCVISGRPKPEITWVKNNNMVDSDIYNMTTIDTPTSDNLSSFIVTSTFQMLKPLKASDAGNYSCFVTMKFGDSMSMRATLVAVKQQPIFTDPLLNITADLNRTAFIRCQCYAYPIPEIIWFKDGKAFDADHHQSISLGSWRQVTDVRNNWLLIHESLITIQGILKSDEGHYVCRAENVIGATNRTNFLTVKTPPEPPSVILPISFTWESIELTWTPGSNGGYPQYYRVFYYVKGGNYNASNPALLGSGLDGIVNVTEGTSINITGLLPGKTYVVIVTGCNLLGISDGVENEINTPPFPIPAIISVTYVVRNTAIYFPKTQPIDEDLCVYLRMVNQTNPDALNFTCRAIEGGSYEYSVYIPMNDHKWEASYCLQRRNDVCGKPSVVEVDRRPIGTESAIALGVVCSLVFISLVALAVVVVQWFRKNKEEQNGDPKSSIQQDKPVHSRKWSDIGQLHAHNNNNNNSFKRRLVTDSVISTDSERPYFEHETSNSDLSKSVSDRGSQGYKNKIFYYDPSKVTVNISDQTNIEVEDFDVRDKVFHEVVV